MWHVFIVEDDPDMREFFESGVARSEHLCVAASAGTVAQALALLDEADPPDVLLTDLQLPDGSGLDIIREVRRRFPACEPLVISMFGDEDNVLAAIEAGALGYIHKDATPDDIAQVAVAILSERFGRYLVGTTVEVDGGLGLMSWIPARA